MSERPKLSLKSDYPPKPPTAGFDVTEFRRKANRALDTLKKEIYASGMTPAEVSTQWSAARDTHDRIIADAERYRAAATDEERAGYVTSMKEAYASLAGDVADDLLEARQSTIQTRPKEKGPTNYKTSHKSILRALASSSEAHIAYHEMGLRMKEIREQIAKLEQEEAHPKPGALKEASREPEILALENELREIESARAEATPREPASEVLVEENAESADSYEGAANYPVPAVIEQVPVEQGRKSSPEGNVTALPEGSMPAEVNDQTPAEARKRLSDLISERAPEENGPDQRLLAIESKLKEQTAKFYSKENRLLRLGYGDLKKTEREYNRALFELASARKSSEGLNGLEIVQQVIKKGEEAKYQARKEAMSVDDRYLFEKALGLIPKGNAWLEAKMGVNNARALRAFTTAALVTGGSAMLGAFGTAGIGTLLGIGAYKAGRSFASAVLGAAGGAAAGSWFDRVFGKKNQEASKQRLEGLAMGETLNRAEFSRIQQQVSKLIEQSDDRTRERNKILVQALTSLGIGAGVSSILTAFNINIPFIDSTDAGNSSLPRATSEQMNALAKGQSTTEGIKEYLSKPHPELVREQALTPDQVVAQAASDAGNAFPDSFGSVEPWSAEFESGEGANRLFIELREHYGAIYQNPADAPPTIQYILDESKTPSELSRDFGFIDENGKSPIVPKGARLGFDDHGRLLFHPGGNDPTLEQALMKVTPEGEVKMSDVELPKEARVEAPIEPAPKVAGPTEPLTSVPVSSPVAETLDVLNPQDPGELRTAPSDITFSNDVDLSPAATAEAAPATPASSPEVPAAEAPATPEPVPDAKPAEAAPTPSGMEPFVNGHGLKIDPAIAQTYADAQKTVSVFGGSFEQRFELAQQFAQSHPGTTIYLEGPKLVFYDGEWRPWTMRVEFDPATGIAAEQYQEGSSIIGRPSPQGFIEKAR